MLADISTAEDSDFEFGVMSVIEQTIFNGQETTAKLSVKTREGCRIYSHVHLLPVQNRLGRLVLYIGVLSEVSPDLLDTDKSAVSAAERLADAIESAMQWQSSITRARRRLLDRIPFPEGFVISDPWRTDNPLVWCSPDFYRLTGYAAAEILGRNCRFLQVARSRRLRSLRENREGSAAHRVAPSRRARTRTRRRSTRCARASAPSAPSPPAS